MLPGQFQVNADDWQNSVLSICRTDVLFPCWSLPGGPQFLEAACFPWMRQASSPQNCKTASNPFMLHISLTSLSASSLLQCLSMWLFCLSLPSFKDLCGYLEAKITSLFNNQLFCKFNSIRKIPFVM